MFVQSRRTMLMGTIVVGLAAILSANLFAASGSSGGSVTKYEGKIKAVDLVNPEVSLKLQNGTIVRIRISSSTKLERNGIRVRSLAAFKIGDRGQARIDSATIVRTKFEATGP